MSLFYPGVRYPKSYFQIVGIDGVGKTSAVDWLKRQPEFQSSRYVFVREPGGTVFADYCRGVLKGTPLPTESQLALVWTARFDLFENVIWPAIKANKIVISDRGDACSVVYQKLLRGSRSLLSLHFRLMKRLYNSLDADVVRQISPNYCLLESDPADTVQSLSRFRSQADLFDDASVEIAQARQEDYHLYEQELYQDLSISHSWRTIRTTAPFFNQDKVFEQIALYIVGQS